VLDKAPDGSLVSTGEQVDRSRIYGAQTPQMFLSEDLKAAYGQGYDLSFTDDASVASGYGIPLSYIAGERNNIKLTTPEDLSLAEAILQLSC
jgi:2-C-methyl-D-erythritol 4-phosphate cytidylyltransferase